MTEAELATEHSAILPKRKRNENMIAAVDEFIERQKTAQTQRLDASLTSPPCCGIMMTPKGFIAMETMNELQNTTGMPAETAASIRRYMEIQREMARLEKEKEQIRDALVKELSGNVPAVWHPTVDGKPLAVTHGHRTIVRYDEQILRERLGEKYAEILEIDGTKIRKNRELVRPLLASVLDRIGTPSAARVETAIKSGSLTAEAFRGAFQKTVTPFLSVRIESQPPESPAADAPF